MQAMRQKNRESKEDLVDTYIKKKQKVEARNEKVAGKYGTTRKV